MFDSASRPPPAVCNVPCKSVFSEKIFPCPPVHDARRRVSPLPRTNSKQNSQGVRRQNPELLLNVMKGFHKFLHAMNLRNLSERGNDFLQFLL